MSQINDMRTQALAQHEVFLSYVEAGFTRSEALELVKAQIVAMIQTGGNQS